VRGRGYAKAAFEAAWKQYLPALPTVISVPSVRDQAHSLVGRTEHTHNTEGRHLPRVTPIPPESSESRSTTDPEWSPGDTNGAGDGTATA